VRGEILLVLGHDEGDVLVRVTDDLAGVIESILDRGIVAVTGDVVYLRKRTDFGLDVWIRLGDLVSMSARS
jgi:hypothetical protein